MKLRFRFRNYGGHIGAVCFDGTIDIHPRLLSHPLVLVSIVLHELTHWILDALGVHGEIHRWSDLLYTYIGLYDYNVNRASLRERVRSPKWDKLARETWRVGDIK